MYNPLVQYSPIKVEAICKKGSEKYGATATCTMEIAGLNVEVSQFGHTKEEAKKKLLNFIYENNPFANEKPLEKR